MPLYLAIGEDTNGCAMQTVKNRNIDVLRAKAQ